MISCDFFGGLGNNLFQLATVYSIQKLYGVELQIPSHVNRGNIGIYGQETNLEFERLFENQFTYNNNLVLQKYVHSDTDLGTTDFSYKEIPLYDNICYHGYFQSPKYFLGVDISKELVLRKDNIEMIRNRYANLLSGKTISLHYRLGGDRVTSHMQHYHKTVSIDYYKKALSLIHGLDEHKILVFSDKIDECRQLLSSIEQPLTFIENENNVIDFTMISLCDINIVGNSTFSWWAAYMNQSETKTVIVPKTEWFGPGYKHFNLEDCFPKNWITL